MVKTKQSQTLWDFIATLTTRIKTLEEFELVMSSRPTIPGIEKMSREQQDATIKVVFADWKGSLDPETARDLDVIIKTLARAQAARFEHDLVEGIVKQIKLEHAAELSTTVKFTAPQMQKLDALREGKGSL